MQSYDYVVIGAGPGGYVSAIRASQLGLKVALIEKYTNPGGTCLNVGCIPSKAMLDSSELYHLSKEKFSIHGIDVEPKLNFQKLLERKNKVVSDMVNGVNYLLKKNKIDFIQATATFENENTILLIKEDKKNQKIQFKNAFIATGSKPVELPFLNFSNKIISSTGALNLTKVPKTMTIIGGGVIGLELGSVYSRLGTEVTVVEFLDTIIPSMDREITKQLKRSLEKLGIKFLLSTKVIEGKETKTAVTLKVEDKKEKISELKSEIVLVAVGRRPYTDALGLENIAVKTDDRGFISVNEKFQTSQSHIYAAGDVIGGQMLAHKAEEEGVFIAESILGQKPHINYNLIPGVVYTWPELASVGATEEELKKEGVEYNVGKFPFTASGRARAAEESEGMVKVLANKKTDEILGAHMLGARCADLIHEIIVAMEFKAAAEDIARICHAHPTFSEAIKEAALAATENRPIHI